MISVLPVEVLVDWDARSSPSEAKILHINFCPSGLHGKIKLFVAETNEYCKQCLIYMYFVVTADAFDFLT
jgi:hypothetical protein